MTQVVSRRGFVNGALAAVAGAGLLGIASGCAPSSQGAGANETELSSTGAVEPTADEEVDCDIVVVGGGMSGLTAAVRAAELGANVAIVEVKDALGGNGSCTEGVFAVGSHYQQEQGIDISLADIISSEQDFFKFKIDNLFWKDMVSASADTLAWLESQGVEFSGVVDSYSGLGKVPVFHWYKVNSAESHIRPMTERVNELGITSLCGKRAFQLAMSGDEVCGVYARGKDDAVTKVNAKAVILTTGGYADNSELIRKKGIDPDLYFVGGFGDHVGDGYEMAKDVGARDDLHRSCFVREATVEYNSGSCAYPLMVMLFNEPRMLWVNGDGERFADEGCLTITTGCMSNAVQNQANPWAIFTESMLQEFPARIEGVEGTAYDEAQEMLERGSDDLLKADTPKELAQAMGISPEALEETMRIYDGYCEAGVDDDFAKDPSLLQKMDGSLYAARLKQFVMTSVGCIGTNRRAEVVDEFGEPIPGLYAAGVDGCELYYGTYTISVPASCNGNNAYSGKNAAQNAVEYIS